MPRKSRTKSQTNVYHVIIKGIDRQLIFEERKDYQKYLRILKKHKEECHFKLLAYCLMSNHIHILLQTVDTPLETIFRKINTHYACWFNMKYQRTGHLQDGRYFSEPVEDLRYLQCAVNYIHLNPAKAGLETAPGESYPWSSIYEYKSQTSNLVDINSLYLLLGQEELLSNSNVEGVEFMDTDKIKKRLPDDVAKEIILEECNCSSASDFLNFSVKERNTHLANLHSRGLSIRQLNRLTGVPRGIVQSVICK